MYFLSKALDSVNSFTRLMAKLEYYALLIGLRSYITNYN